MLCLKHIKNQQMDALVLFLNILKKKNKPENVIKR